MKLDYMIEMDRRKNPTKKKRERETKKEGNKWIAKCQN